MIKYIPRVLVRISIEGKELYYTQQFEHHG